MMIANQTIEFPHTVSTLGPTLQSRLRSPSKTFRRKKSHDSVEGFGRSERVRLEPFQEVCGLLESVYQTDTDLVLVLSAGILSFSTDSMEATICESEIEVIPGTWVTIFRTQNPQTPIIVNQS